MIGSTQRPCPTCSGTGVIVVKNAGQPDVPRTCPVCKGTKVTTGIVAK